MTNVRVGIGDISDRVAQTVIAGDVGDLWRVEGEIGTLLARLDIREFLQFGEYTRRIYHGWAGGQGRGPD